MTRNAPFRVGIVGANLANADPLRHSWGARAHLPALTALPEFEVVAVCTNHLQTALQTADHFGIPHAFADVATMLTSVEVDIVDVCVAAAAHRPVVLQATAAGKHVVCEWPLGADLDEAVELSHAARAAGVRTAICLQARYAPVYQHLRSLLADDFVGRLRSCSLNGSMAIAPSPRTPSLALIHGGHCLDTLAFVTGQELEPTSAVVETGSDANHVLVHGRLGGGALVDVNIRHVAAMATGFTLEINGTEGVIVAGVDGHDLPGRGIRSLGEQLNQATLRGARVGEPLAPLAVPDEHRWAPERAGAGPALAIAQLLRRFAASIDTGERFASDFALALGRHEQFASLQALSRRAAGHGAG